jgi:hypothetical protein
MSQMLGFLSEQSNILYRVKCLIRPRHNKAGIAISHVM